MMCDCDGLRELSGMQAGEDRLVGYGDEVKAGRIMRNSIEIS